MAIVSQNIIEQSLQGDNRVRVRYEYTDNQGGVTTIGPITHDAGVDLNADMLARVPQVEQGLVDTELAEIIQRVEGGLLKERVLAGESPTTITSVYATPAQVHAALFDWWMNAGPIEARWLVPAIDALSDLELLGMLSVDQATVDAIRVRAARLSQIDALLMQEGL